MVPFFVTVAAVKLLPVPVTSTSAETIWREPSTPLRPSQVNTAYDSGSQSGTKTHLLKFVIVAVNVLSAFAVMTPEVSNVCAMFVFPHGFAVDGRCTLLRAGVPATPRTGAIAACALTPSEAERRRAAVAMTLEKYMIAMEGETGLG